MVGVITTRPLEASDISRLVALEREFFPTPWAAQHFEAELNNDRSHFLVLADSDEIIGYGGVLLVAEDAHIATIGVIADRRGEGLGRRLMLALVEIAIDTGAEHLTLEVAAGNRQAQALYRQFGMAPVGARRKYYGDEDALIMWAHDIHSREYRALLDSIRERP